MKWLALLLLSGCSVSYVHLSDIDENEFNLDLVCAEVVKGERVEVSAAVCDDLHHPTGLAKFEVKYNLRKQK